MSAKNIDPAENSQQLLEEAEALIWGLLDENIDAASAERLEKLMTNAEVRQRYVQCVELHCDLRELFQEQEKPPKSPVLGSLADVYPPSVFPGQQDLNTPPA